MTGHRRAMKREIPFLFVAMALTVVLSACGSGVSQPTVEAKNPTELLTGSWYAMETENDQEINRIVLTLTPDRYIYHKAEYENGEIDFHERWSGEWTADETTITTTTVWWLPEDERVSAEQIYSDPVSYEKDYYFTDDGDVLYVHRWNREDARHYERFSRHPGLGDISGSYVFDDHFTTNNGDEWQVRWTYEITSDSFVEAFQSFLNGEQWERWRLAGELQVDRSNYYMFVSVTEVEQTFEGEPSAQLDRDDWVGHTVRLAYAPTAESDRIAISRVHNELTYDRDSNTWTDREDNPYGNYWVFAKRQ